LVALPGKFAKYIIFKLVYFEKLEEFVEKTNNGRQNIESKPDGWKTKFFKCITFVQITSLVNKTFKLGSTTIT